MKKRERNFNRLKSIEANAEPQENGATMCHCTTNESKFSHKNATTNSSQNISTLFVGLTIVSGLTLLGIFLDLGTNTVIESCKRIVTNIWKQAF